MHRALFLLVALVASAAPGLAQETVRFNDQDLWLSGGNVAWVDFSRDIGPGATNLARFEEAFSDLHASGGNSMRLWLHTTGDGTPAYSTTEVGVITGPGEGTIADLEAILDEVSAALDTEDLIALRDRVEGDEKASAEQAATDWLTENGLI